jgi:hypothetical protein
MTITLTSEEAQQVLEALEEAKIDIFDWGQYASHHHREKYNLYGDTVKNDDLIETLRARLAQPEPEPEPEPVAWYWSNGIEFTIAFEKTDGHAPMYLHPPQREWQGLTDEEIIDTANNAPFDTMVSAEDYIYVIARAIEAKLKEKNT